MFIQKGATLEEILKAWDDGEPIPTVERGGIGPGYEQALQILAIEIIRANKDQPLPMGEAYQLWGEETIEKLSEDYGGFSGTQASYAKALAYRYIRDGWYETLGSAEDQKVPIIQISKTFPCGK